MCNFVIDGFCKIGKEDCIGEKNCLYEKGPKEDKMEETRIIERVGHYSTDMSNPEDCIMCHNAKMGTVLVDGVCLDCLDIMLVRKVQIDRMLSLMCDPENQPHQFVGDEGLAFDEMFYK